MTYTAAYRPNHWNPLAGLWPHSALPLSAPGDTYEAEGTVDASDSTNAARLAGLTYVASPSTAWTTGQAIAIGGFAFHWTGSAWAAGAA